MQDLLALQDAYPVIWQWIKLALAATLAGIAVFVILRLESKAARKLLNKRKNINIRFVESVGRFVVILVAAQWVMMSSPLTRPFGQVLFRGTAVLAAIAGFAAQPVIADIICGLMMIASRPFNIGDRIGLEDGTEGIVKDISLRHVMLQGIDSKLFIVPNSKLNAMTIVNMSYQSENRSIHFRFNVSYDTDADRAMAVIRRAVEESPYSLPGKTTEQGKTYGPVYFIEYAASALVMATTVYYAPEHPTEAVKSDINARVKRALDENGIEIPYNYLNVVVNDIKQERGDFRR